MSTDQQEARISPASLMWGIFWRSVVWYAATGAVLGGLYGCATIAVAMFSADASEVIEPSEVWASRALIGLFGMTGFIGGGRWRARSVGRCGHCSAP